MKKLLIITLSFLIILLNGCSLNKYFIKPAKSIILTTISNKNVQHWGSTICIFGYVYCDATRDAMVFAPEQTKLDPLKWHGWKNGALIFLFSGAGLKGLEIGQSHITLWQSMKRTVKGEAPVSYVLWQYRFHYIKYNNPFDYSTEHNTHRVMIPSFITFNKDKYIILNPMQMVFLDINLAIEGIGSLFNILK